MSFANITAIIIIVLLIGLITYPMIRKTLRRETCCGSVKEKTIKKHLKHISGKYTLSVEGMRCKNCERQVANAINEIEGLSSKVSLEKKEAIISYEKLPFKEEAIDAVQKLGFIAYIKK